jgi:ferric-dicitrate binding protein FerR (iron transport regulator)
MEERHGELAAVAKGLATTAQVAYVPNKNTAGQASAIGTRVWRGRVAGLGTWTLQHSLRKWGGIVVASIAAIIVFAMRTTSVHHTGLTRTYATGPDQQATVTLDDGTRVTLAPRTTLRMLAYDLTGRTVQLDGDGGEAYFDVAPSAKAAFTVRSGVFTMRVLGTTFMVRHPAGTAQMHVAVAEGKVNVSAASRWRPSVTLAAGAIGEVDDSTVHVTTVNDLAPGTEWVHGRLVFRDMPVSAVLKTLSQWYGYQFRCEDNTLALRTVTIGLNMKSSAAALAILEDVLRINLSVIGDTVTLTPRIAQQDKHIPRLRSYDMWIPTREIGR